MQSRLFLAGIPVCSRSHVDRNPLALVGGEEVPGWMLKMFHWAKVPAGVPL